MLNHYLFMLNRYVLQMNKSVTNVQDLGSLANSLTRDYGTLATDSRGIVAASQNLQVK